MVSNVPVILEKYITQEHTRVNKLLPINKLLQKDSRFLLLVQRVCRKSTYLLTALALFTASKANVVYITRDVLRFLRWKNLRLYKKLIERRLEVSERKSLESIDTGLNNKATAFYENYVEFYVRITKNL